MSASGASGTEALTFPPLMSGEATQADAMGLAARRATLGCDAGLVTYALPPSHIEAAMVLAPEMPLAQAMAMLPGRPTSLIRIS
ncbi:MAG: biotin/lipoate--protein ligase family protein [Paracoccaceae bacterium]